MITAIVRPHETVFGMIERVLNGWFLGLLARFAFAAVLLVYFLNSAMTKVGPGFLVADNAYYQIVPPIIEAAGYDVANVAFFPWKIIVFMGTYSEFVLPVLIVVGLFTRIAALGMIFFVLVQSYVDVTIHQIGAEATGAWFDRFPDAAVMDQRLLWVVPLIYLVVKGAGALSLDRVAYGLVMNREGAHSPQVA